MASSNDATWDEALGVWSGGEAVSSFDETQFPDPLYIFGYGSLIWKPGDILASSPVSKCSAIGWKRIFAQKSCDHRGTVKFPGFVLTLIDYESLHDLEQNDADADMRVDECEGLIWAVSGADIPNLIKYLDFRERGGYLRQMIKVRLHQSTSHHSKGDITKALVYRGSTSNPNFYYTSRKVCANIISCAHGPSGPNYEYLFKLVDYLVECGISDPYLENLMHDVILRCGRWKKNGVVLKTILAISETVTKAEGATNKTNRFDRTIVGWGSNEFNQLEDSERWDEGMTLNGETDGRHGSKDKNKLISIAKQLIYHPYDSASKLPSIRPTADIHQFLVAGGGTSGFFNDGVLLIKGALVPAVLQFIKSCSVIPMLSTQSSHFDLSQLVEEADQFSGSFGVMIEGVENISIGQDHLLLLLPGGRVCGIGSNSHGQCLPGSNSALRFLNGDLFLSNCEISVDCHRLSNFYDAAESGFAPTREGKAEMSRIHNHAHNAVIFSIKANTNRFGRGGEDLNIVKCCVGLRHSSALTSNGGLLVWGDSRHGQVVLNQMAAVIASDSSNKSGDCGEQLTPWFPPDKALLTDLACGARFTVLIDSLGRMFTLGSDNSHGSLGRECTPLLKGCPTEIAPPLELSYNEYIHWQKVSCGWSHCVARGMRTTGNGERTVAFYGWGRCDMGQYCASKGPEGNYIEP